MNRRALTHQVRRKIEPGHAVEQPQAIAERPLYLSALLQGIIVKDVAAAHIG